MLSEFVGLKIDNLIFRILYENKEVPLVFSRYYDDILISGDTKEDLRSIEKLIIESLTRIDLAVNKSKTKIQFVHTSNILGLRVHNHTLTVPKEFKKILRVRIYELELHDKRLLKNGDDDSEEMYKAKELTGRVIGSLWYIIKNSSSDTGRYSLLLRDYMEILGEYGRMLNEILGGNDIFEDDVDFY